MDYPDIPMKELLKKAKKLYKEYGELSIPFLRKKLRINLKQAIELKTMLASDLCKVSPVKK